LEERCTAKLFALSSPRPPLPTTPPPNNTQVALKNSPLNQGKKALAKAQAGDYDAAATRAKIEQYIKDNKVMVFSW
jgi:hypothetical protein